MFLKNKYTTWYNNIITNAKYQNRKKSDVDYYESHHIIPKCLGGIEEVLLTAKEHYICHLLLCRMLVGPDKHKMINALIRMMYSRSNGQKRYTSRTYSLVRKLISEKNSEMFKGKPKSNSARKNMKGKSGKWKRTDEHKSTCSIAQKKRFEKSQGTFTGKKFTDEMTQKRNKTRKDRGIKPTFTGKGCRHFTNGVVNKFCTPGNEPEGFYLGRTMKRKDI